MRYRPEYPPDVIRHKFHHDKFVNGISVRRRPDDEVVREEPGMRVLVVRPKASSAQRKQATNVARTIRREFQIQFGIYEATDENNVEWQKHVLLACKNDRAIGFLLLQKRYASQEWFAPCIVERCPFPQPRRSPRWDPNPLHISVFRRLARGLCEFWLCEAPFLPIQLTNSAKHATAVQRFSTPSTGAQALSFV